MTTTIAVGYDGSPGAAAALAWALDEAERTGSDVRLCFAREPLGLMPAAPYVPATSLPPDGAPDRAAAVMLDEAAHAAAKTHPGVTVTAAFLRSGAAAALEEQSRTARLLVLGAHGHSAFTQFVLGSVTIRVSGHARCPVVVVRDLIRQAAASAPIVAGVDESPAAERVLDFAFAQASSRGVPLRVVRACAPVRPVWLPAADLAAPTDDDRDRLHRLLDDFRQRDPGVVATATVRTGSPARALLDAAHHAQLIVVGSRGRGGLRGALLGSVGQQILHHAPCTVAVVR